MPQIIQQFFSLLRAGLWDNHTPDSSLFKGDVDWKMLYRLAQEQTVLAIVWDGIEKLPLELRPDKAISFKWYGYVIKVEQTNRTINDKVVEVFNLYKSVGLHPILLKGAGIASLYRNPLRRGCGDIDIYIGEEDSQRANQVVENELKGTNINELERLHEHEYHTTFKLPDGLTIENHSKFTVHFAPAITRRFNSQLDSWYPNRGSFVEINNQKIEVSPDAFNTQYVFIHMYQHLFALGIGLRQICDWAVMIYNLDNKDLELVGYKKGWQVMAGFLVEYLGVEPERIPHYKGINNKKNRVVLDLILEGGNFGHQLISKRPNGYWSGKIYSFSRQISRWPRLASISFVDTFNYLVFRKMKEICSYISELFSSNTSRK